MINSLMNLLSKAWITTFGAAAYPIQSPVIIEAFAQDPLANTIALLTLIGMAASIIGVTYLFLREQESPKLFWPNWIIPMLSLFGLGVSAYLSFVEVSGSDAICGPVGNCNSVQNSPYAYLFGVIPIGIIGITGYIFIFFVWLLNRMGPSTWRKATALIIWGMAWFGVLFSSYLTFLEPFVIGATCMWCITSAVLITLILWASTGPAKDAWKIEEDDYEDAIEANEQTFDMIE